MKHYKREDKDDVLSDLMAKKPNLDAGDSAAYAGSAHGSTGSENSTGRLYQFILKA
ncbi:unnamed protein product [Protopolystoma xenopodis]|uniref:Uncharacterized protein n=1 Tax=Protopolystoma xenopodis TaxID=117903 RepID=A0A448XLC5_9PLAT|nr:unnamed protein product [Protopolystoma xenopodis]